MKNWFKNRIADNFKGAPTSKDILTKHCSEQCSEHFFCVQNTKKCSEHSFGLVQTQGQKNVQNIFLPFFSVQVRNWILENAV